ncbi:Fc.00g052890.m01.CDS01 [Cosmosporella sp. VM-42]
MTQSTDPGAEKSIFNGKGVQKSHDILTCTIKAPPFSYAHLEVITDGPEIVELDNLQVKSYCTAALKQFLGITGAAIPLDILKVQSNQCWIRVPRQDLGSFAAAITAWKGITEGETQCILRIRQCSDFLGLMVGSDGQERLWGP